MERNQIRNNPHLVWIDACKENGLTELDFEVLEDLLTPLPCKTQTDVLWKLYGQLDYNNRYFDEYNEMRLDDPHVKSGFVEPVDRIPDLRVILLRIKGLIEKTEAKISGSCQKTIEDHPLIAMIPSERQYDSARTFLRSLSQHEGKLVWPESEIQDSLPALIKAIFPEMKHHHIFTARHFVWSDLAPIKNTYLGSLRRNPTSIVKRIINDITGTTPARNQ